MTYVTILEEIHKLYKLCQERSFFKTADHLKQTGSVFYEDLKQIMTETNLSDEKLKDIQHACKIASGYSLWDLRLVVEEVLKLRTENDALKKQLQLKIVGQLFGTTSAEHSDGIQTGNW